MYTYQDFINENDRLRAVSTAIVKHLNSDLYKTAKLADEYDHQKNHTVMEYVRTIFTMTGSPVEDFTASNNKLCSNFFHRLNTQRCTYLLGNGVTFSDNKEETIDEDGVQVVTDTTKEFLGNRFDTDLKKTGYSALIHGVAFGYWNVDRLHTFKIIFMFLNIILFNI